MCPFYRWGNSALPSLSPLCRSNHTVSKWPRLARSGSWLILWCQRPPQMGSVEGHVSSQDVRASVPSAPSDPGRGRLPSGFPSVLLCRQPQMLLSPHPTPPREFRQTNYKKQQRSYGEKWAGDLMDWVDLRTPGVCQVPLGSQQVKDFSISFPLPGSCPCKLSSDGAREGARGEALRSLLCAGCRARRLPASSVPGGLLFRNNMHEDLFPHCWASS